MGLNAYGAIVRQKYIIKKIWMLHALISLSDGVGYGSTVSDVTVDVVTLLKSQAVWGQIQDWLALSSLFQS